MSVCQEIQLVGVSSQSWERAAAVAIKAPALFGISMANENEGFYVRNASLFVLPLLTGYFVWKRRFVTGRTESCSERFGEPKPSISCNS